MSQKKHLTFEEHQEIGQQLHEMRDKLVHITVQVGNVYPLNRGFFRMIDKARQNIDELRCKLDNAVFEEYPEKEFQELVSAYYGQEDNFKPTWNHLCSLEPRLLDLFNEARSIKDDGGPSFCANKIWYKKDGFKIRMSMLVGIEAEKLSPILKSSAAYDVAYNKIYNVLPNCRNCNCL